MIAWIYSGSVGRSAATTEGENQMVGGKTCLEWISRVKNITSVFVVSMTLKKMPNRSRKVLLSASNESFKVVMCFSILPKTSKYHPHKENTQ